MPDVYHVLPIDDLQSHEESAQCACEPKIEENGALVMHNSYDGREIVERAVDRYARKLIKREMADA